VKRTRWTASASSSSGWADKAVEYHRQAVALFRELGERFSEAWALNGLGEAAGAAGRPADALAHHTAACAIADEIGSAGLRARAHAGVGRAYHALGQRARARHHYERALALYTELSMPEADDVRARLDALAAASRPSKPNGDGVTVAHRAQANGDRSHRDPDGRPARHVQGR
jgi:tetratricopeptide (TPR) repeat protein